MRSCVRVCLCLAVASGLFFVDSAFADPLDPNAYTSLGTLNPVGDVTINTDTLTVTVSGGATYTGVLQSQGAGNPEIAVFTFDDVALGSSINVSVGGSRPLALLSQADFNLATPISVKGAGYGFGEGPGAIGLDASVLPSYGGGFAGMGGEWDSLVNPAQYLYGDLRSVLEGGSAGGNGSFPGNAGGGAIELGAVGAVTIAAPASGVISTTQMIDASGASWPGQSGWTQQPGLGGGGGILIHGATASVDSNSILTAAGGYGSHTGGNACCNYVNTAAGGGGGGRITIVSGQFQVGDIPSVASLDVHGGNGGTISPGQSWSPRTGQPGEDGYAEIVATTTTIHDAESAAIVSGKLGTAHLITENLVVESGGDFTLTDSQFSVQSLTGTGNVGLTNSTLSVGSTDADSTFAGALSGTGTLAKTGAGTMALSGANTFSGDTTVSGGTLQTSSASTSGDITNDAAVIFDQDTYGTYAGNVTGSGDFTKRGTGTLALTGNHQQTGTVSVEDGSILVQSGSLVDSDLVVAAGGRFENQAGVVQVADVTNGGIVVGSSRSTGTFTNQSSGEVRLASGQSLVAEGAGPHVNAGMIDAVGASVEFDGALTNAADTGLIYGRDAVMRFDGGLTNQGSVALSFGTSDVYGDIDNQAGGEVVVSGLSNASFLGDLTNNGDVQTGTGSTAVFFGDVTGAGSFSGAGQVLIEGDLRPGNSAAAVFFGGDLLLGNQTLLDIELGGTEPGSEHDQLVVNGDLILAGVLAVSVLDGYELSAGDSFKIFDAPSISGSFSSTSLPELSGALYWETASLLSNGILQVIPEPNTALLLGIGLAGLGIKRRRTHTSRP